MWVFDGAMEIDALLLEFCSDIGRLIPAISARVLGVFKINTLIAFAFGHLTAFVLIS